MRMVTKRSLAGFQRYLQERERSAGTIEKYLHDVRNFAAGNSGRPVTKDAVLRWKGELSGKYRPATVNAMLAALNAYLGFAGWDDCKVKALRLQKRMFREPGREMTRSDYEKLLEAARSCGKERLALLMETICSTGIRVSEVQYITLEAARTGRTEISLKGKIRTILLPHKLCRKLLSYGKKQKIASGELFLTRSGKGISRKQIWAEMKALCRTAGVEESKVFPHNLRHLFARIFHQSCRDINRLADVLGHNSIETTRIYLLSTGVEHAHSLDRLGLVS